MKQTEFEKVIEGIDLSTEQGKLDLLARINDSESSLMTRKESAFNEKYSKLETEYNTLKTSNETAANATKEANTKLEALQKESTTWKNRAYIYKNVDNTLDDAGVADFNALVNARMAINSKLTYEEAAKEVGTKYFGKTAQAQVAPVQPAEEPAGVRARASTNMFLTPTEDNSKESQLEKFRSLGRK